MKNFFLLVLVLMSVSGCGGIDPDSPEAKRKDIFKEMMRVSESMGGMYRERLPFNQKRFHADALRLQELSKEPWQYYDNDADIEARRQEFDQLALRLEKAAVALSEASANEGFTLKQSVQLFKDVEQSCKSCHAQFRNY